MAQEIVDFVLEADDVLELDRLAGIHTAGDRATLFREAIRIMAAQERAARLQRLQARIHAATGVRGLSEDVDDLPQTPSRLTAAILEARAVITACDATPLDDMDAFFYARGYNELRFAVEDLLAAIEGHLGRG